jgi:hypothetical protein
MFIKYNINLIHFHLSAFLISDENQIKEVINKINTNLQHIEIKNIIKSKNLEFFHLDYYYKNEEIQRDLLNEIKLLQYNRFFLTNHFMQKFINIIKKTPFSPLSNALHWYF